MTNGKLNISTNAQMELVDITSQLQRGVEDSGVKNSILTVYNPHTTAGLTINEGADPDVADDIIGVFKQFLPDKYPYKHREGNSPSHIMATLTGSSVTVFIENGLLKLGTWQRIFFCEFDGPRSRKIFWKIT